MARYQFLIGIEADEPDRLRVAKFVREALEIWGMDGFRANDPLHPGNRGRVTVRAVAEKKKKKKEDKDLNPYGIIL